MKLCPESEYSMPEIRQTNIGFEVTVSELFYTTHWYTFLGGYEFNFRRLNLGVYKTKKKAQYVAKEFILSHGGIKVARN